MNEVEQATKRKWHNIEIKGNWELKYEPTNTLGPNAFGGYHIPAYSSPYDQKKVWLKGVNGEAKNGFIMDNLVLSFNPDKFVDHKNKISFLLCHPEIAVVGVPDLDKIVVDSKNARKITLTYKDFAELDAIEEEDFIDRILGKLSLDGGKDAVGLTKLRYILAYCGHPYRDVRFTGEKEKKVLRSKLKKFVKRSYASAQVVENAMKKLDLAKATFEFKEMVRLGILKYDNITYKYNSVPVGVNFDECEAFFNNNPEVRTAGLQKLYDNIKE